MVFLGTVICMTSSNWMLIWVGLEINLIGFATLMICSGSKGCSEGGIKYFIIQSLGSVLVLISVILSEWGLWWQSILLNSWLMMSDSIINYLKMVSFFIFGVGLLLKIGSFPFYSWVPQVVSMVDSWSLCFILLTWQKLAPLIIIVYTFSNFEALGVGFLLILVGALSGLVGGICGMGETRISNLLAYSSIGHTGWLIFSCSHGFGVFLSYFFVYFFVSLIVFMILWKMGTTHMMSLFDLNKNSFVFWVFFICVLSLGGLPPFLGFLGKWLVMVESVKCGMWMEMSILLMGSLFSIFYYLKLGILVLMSKDSTLGGEMSSSSWSNSFLFIFVLTYLFGVNLFGVSICLMFV
uniref:NADH-ubiquinone oxidoreductase chain 2 n=1 Tax=Neolepetopsis sp. TaxID=3071115 RepID=A0AA96HRL8_9GAST|nr:NADH dehydrogenase subunit 2 [Neolepetopsis sp.]